MIAGTESMHGSDDNNRHGASGFEPEFLLAMAKEGDGAALGQLLERYRNYMGLLVRLQVGRRLRSKVDVDDLLQEIWLEIHRKIALVASRCFWKNSTVMLWICSMPIERGCPDPGVRSRDSHSRL